MNTTFNITAETTHIDVMNDPRVLFPHSGSDTRTSMRRIAVLCDVQTIVGKIHSWGTGATKTNTLDATIQYYGNFRCTPAETKLAIYDYIASFVPGGLDADLSAIGRDALRDLMRECGDTARDQEKRVRKMMRVAA